MSISKLRTFAIAIIGSAAILGGSGSASARDNTAQSLFADLRSSGATFTYVRDGHHGRGMRGHSANRHRAIGGRRFGHDGRRYGQHRGYGRGYGYRRRGYGRGGAALGGLAAGAIIGGSARGPGGKGRWRGWSVARRCRFLLAALQVLRCLLRHLPRLRRPASRMPLTDCAPSRHSTLGNRMGLGRSSRGAPYRMTPAHQPNSTGE